MISARWCLLSLCLAAWVAAATAAERDPTMPPATAGVALPPGAINETGQEPAPNMSVLIQNGVPYLVVGTRLIGVGRKVGAATLERITETEIWLREGRKLSKLPRFMGIQRNVVAASVACDGVAPAPAPGLPGKSALKTAHSKSVQAVTPVVPCTGTQP